MSNQLPGRRYWAHNSRSKMNTLLGFGYSQGSRGRYRPGNKISPKNIKYIYGKGNK